MAADINSANVDRDVVDGFGDEWQRFDQEQTPHEERRRMFRQYFDVFPWDELPESAEGADIGCGSGRWAHFVAPRVGKLHCVEPSDAIETARRHLRDHDNCEFHNTDLDHAPIEEGSLDFGYALGVLHHLPDTRAGMESCVELLKPGAPFLVYLYYALENRPWWYRGIWKLSNLARSRIHRLPENQMQLVTDILAGSVYYPLARTAYLLEKIGIDVSNLPLSAYRDRSFLSMRTDCRDRFGTKIEKRFTSDEIRDMMESAGLTDIEFRREAPHWCAVGRRAAD